MSRLGDIFIEKVAVIKCAHSMAQTCNNDSKCQKQKFKCRLRLQIDRKCQRETEGRREGKRERERDR